MNHRIGAILLYTYTHIHTCMYAHIYIYTGMCVYMYIHIQIYTYICVYIYITSFMISRCLMWITKFVKGQPVLMAVLKHARESSCLEDLSGSNVTKYYVCPGNAVVRQQQTPLSCNIIVLHP